MSTSIEDRLSADIGSEMVAANWDDVAHRADQRSSRQLLVSRFVVAAFVALIAAAVVWGQTSGIETIEAPDLADGIPDPNEAPWSEPSPFLILLAWFITWVGSALVGGLAAFASPAHLRAPFIVPRIGRAVGVLSFVTVWNAVVTFAAVGSRFVEPSDFAGWVYGQSTFLLLIMFTGLALLLAFSAEGTWATIRYLFGISILVSLASSILTDDLRAGGVALLAATMGTAAVLAGLAVYVSRASGFRIDPSRTMASVNAWKLGGAALLVLGLSAAAVGANEAIVLQTQMLDLPPTADGLGFSVDEHPHPLLTDEAPYVIFMGDTLDLDMAGYLETQGFERTSAQNAGYSAFLDLRRPRGDSFEAMTAELIRPQSRQWAELRLHAENRDAFSLMRLVRNLGLSSILIGAAVLWSETAITRYLRGSNAWERRHPIAERLGWGLVLIAGVVVLVASPSEGYLLFVLIATALWYVGSKLLVPQPTRPTD